MERSSANNTKSPPTKKGSSSKEEEKDNAKTSSSTPLNTNGVTPTGGNVAAPMQTHKFMVKVGMIGEPSTGKTSLMVKYVEDRFDEDYIETLGVNFMEKTIRLKNVTVTLSVWDLGGQKEYLQLMPLVCNDAKVLLFVFDLTRKQSLSAIREWYKSARKENKYAIPLLIGAKFDLFDKRDFKYKEDITQQARKFARAMKAPLIYCSAAKSINIKKIFQIIVAKVFHLKLKVPEETRTNKPIIEYKTIWSKSSKGKQKKKGSGDTEEKKESS